VEEDDDKDNIGDATIGQHFDAKNRQSVRNLRIREDTAKFLFNLDPNSAHYDPRTRAMRANPLQGEVQSACSTNRRPPRNTFSRAHRSAGPTTSRVRRRQLHPLYG
jgi:hypothetical protein